MKEKLEEARDILYGFLCRQGQPTKALVRVGRLLEEVLADWWDENDVASLPFCFLDDEFPAARSHPQASARAPIRSPHLATKSEEASSLPFNRSPNRS